MATDTAPDTTGGGSSSLPPGVRMFVPPSFYRTPMFPYANLPAQLQDALGLAGRGAGGFTNMASPLMQNIKNGQARNGGGLLGMSAYSFGPNPFRTPVPGGGGVPPGGGGLPPGGVPPGGGGMPPGGGGMPPGGGVPPGGGLLNPPPAPGTPMVRTPSSDPYSPPGYAGPGGPRGTPTPWSPGGPTQRAPSPTATTPAPRSAAPDPRTSGAGTLYNPGSGQTDVNTMVQYVMSLPENQRGNYINAIDQYSAGGGGGVRNLSAALQQGMRQAMPGFDQWYATTVQNRQGSTVGREGLPAWLITALGG